MKQQLTSWEIKGFWPGEPLWTKSVESTVQRRGVTPWMPVTVPGGVHRALEKAGLIDDPNFGTNSLLCEWVEHRWWVYRTWFDGPVHAGRTHLRFDGIDDTCWIYLNGEKIAEHTGIYEPVLADVTARVKQGEKNQLLVILAQPPEEQAQIGWTSRTRTQKARYGYKWDFCTHLVNIGLWQGVYLETTGRARIGNTCVTGDVQDGTGLVRVQAKIAGECRAAAVRLSRNGQTVAEQTVAPDCAWDGALDTTIAVEQPELWWPNTMGAQPLYDVDIVLDDGSDEWHGRIGIRSLDYAQCDGADRTALPYRPVINGETVYIRGVNMTPLDMCYGDVSEDDYRRMFMKLRHLNVNAVRVWGGGVIETETFYRLADENGILIWQEFIQSSSGIDNMPCHDPAFLALLERNSRAGILARRNHVSLTWWSGGNELADAFFHPITEGDMNIAMLKRLVRELDPQRLFLPSSPSGPAFGLDNPEEGHHDVHGNWQYDGVRGHYAKYNASDSMLQSEFGADGMSSVEQLRRILPEADFGVYGMKEHPVLRHHGEWWETLHYRDEKLFGSIANVEQWVAVSQMMQTEAIRYTLLSNRLRRGQNGGSIIWQMNEPFPNVSCTNLVEYYGRTKGVYYAVKRAYAPRCVGLRYDSMIQAADGQVSLLAYVDDLTGCGRAALKLTAYQMDGTVLYTRQAEVALDGGKGSLEAVFTVPQLADGVWLARAEAVLDDGTPLRETYLFSQQEETPLRPFITMEKQPMTVCQQGNTIVMTNEGTKAAMWLHLESADDTDALLDDNDVTLLPGERVTLTIMHGALTGWHVTDLAGRRM